MAPNNSLVEGTSKLYEALSEQSKVEKVSDGAEFTVFRGSIVEVYLAQGLSRSYYSRVVTFLADNGCIAYLQKGNRHVESVIVLLKPPSFEGMEMQPLTGPGRYDKLEARIKVIEKRLGGLDIVKALEELDRTLKKALEEFDRRLTEAEGRK